MNNLHPLTTQNQTNSKKPPEDIAMQKLLNASEVLDAVSSSYFITNTDLEIVHYNKAFLSNNQIDIETPIIGLRPGDVINCLNTTMPGQKCGTSGHCKTCDFRNSILEALDKQETVIREVMVTNQNNKMMAFKLTATPFILENKQFVSVSTLDITDRVKRQLMESLFFHDLINIAGSLSGYLDVIKDFPHEEIINHLPHIKLIADQVLDEVMAQREISRAEQNRLEAEVSEISSAEFLKALSDKISFHPSMRNRYLVISSIEDFTFYSDPRLLDRVLMNMLKNAIEFIKKGETIKLSVFRFEKEITFAVHNPGFIPEELQEGIFKFGFSTKGKGRGQGTYSMRLIGENLLKGKTWFQSNPVTGTTFYLRIPEFMLMEEDL